MIVYRSSLKYLHFPKKEENETNFTTLPIPSTRPISFIKEIFELWCLLRVLQTLLEKTSTDFYFEIPKSLISECSLSQNEEIYITNKKSTN